MARQQPEFKSYRKLLAQDEKDCMRKENTRPRTPEKSVVPGDDNKIFKNFK